MSKFSSIWTGMATVRLTKDDLEKFGSSSLTGRLAKLGTIRPCPLVVEFEESSAGWRERNDGPEIVLIPEYVPACLCEDVLALTGRGFTITVRAWENDPAS